MLRTSIRSVRALGSRPIAATTGRQWQAAVVRPGGFYGSRTYADEKKPNLDASKPAVIPASETTTAAASPPPPSAAQLKADATVIPPSNVPLTPPPPPKTPATTIPSASVPPPPPPPPKRKGFLRRLRNYILTLSILGTLAFGGGVWYSRVNDNFHDFFTEYVPFGEQAVLYFEELDFRKRFPNISNRVTGKPRDSGNSVSIPAQSGASWRVADSGEPSGRQSSALAKVAAAKKESSSSEESKKKPAPKKEPAKPVEAPKPVEAVPAKAPEEAVVPVVSGIPSAPAELAAAPGPVAPTPVKPATPAFKAPEVDEPSRWPPAAPIDVYKVRGNTEPVVRDVVHMLNDIIAVVNADGNSERYGATIGKAKIELNKIEKKIQAIKNAAETAAADQLKGRADTFDKAATDLVDRVEKAMIAQEDDWRQQFATEMQKIKESYDERVKVMTSREQQVYEEKLNNRLLEQAVELSRQFAQDIKDRVETERDGRLGKLNDLSSSVSELEKLATGWNEVVDTNLRTQQLHVAVEAVRASLEDSQHARPFIRELVALKEIAHDDALVNCAIASINPSAYQRGVPSPAELIDRFRRVASEVRKAALLPDDAGVASHASSWVLSKVLFKKEGLAAGNDVESVLTRAQTYLEEGDLDNAAREVNGLKGWAKTLSRDWLGEVRKVLEVQQALDVIATEARLQSLRVE